jgi:spore coat polysaccharide biosynthesis protein SpsF
MIAAIIQARMGSTRFPGKTFCELAGKPLIWHVVNRLKYSGKIDQIIIATTDTVKDDILADWAARECVSLFRGSENNVLERYYHAARQYEADIIVRITADDPFKDPSIIDRVITMLQDEKLDFACNNNPPSFPEGLDTEVFTFGALERAFIDARDDFEKEHVTQFFYRNKEEFRQANLANEKDLSFLRWTIDTESDYKMAERVYRLLYRENNIFQMEDILEILRQNPDIQELNNNVERSAMYKSQR